MLSGDDELYYLMRVLRNTFFTSRRTDSRRPVTVATLDDVVAADPRPLGQPERALEMRELYAAIATLPEDRRLALVAVDVLGLSYREAARALRVREATITTRLFRARKQLARELAPVPNPSRFRGCPGGPPAASACAPQGMRRAPPESYPVEEPHIVTEDPYRPNDEQQPQVAAAALLRCRPAPARLHRHVESLVADPQGSGTRRCRAPGASPRGAYLQPSTFRRPAARRSGRRCRRRGGVVVAIAVGLGGNGRAHTVSFSQATAPTLRAATLPAPPESQAHHAQLAVAVDGVPFPYWSERFGWHSTGSRTDRVDGRTVTTVFYSDSSGRRVGYAILAGSARPGSPVAWLPGVAGCPTGYSPRMARQW